MLLLQWSNWCYLDDSNASTHGTLSVSNDTSASYALMENNEPFFSMSKYLKNCFLPCFFWHKCWSFTLNHQWSFIIDSSIVSYTCLKQLFISCIATTTTIPLTIITHFKVNKLISTKFKYVYSVCIPIFSVWFY